MSNDATASTALAKLTQNDKWTTIGQEGGVSFLSPVLNKIKGETHLNPGSSLKWVQSLQICNKILKIPVFSFFTVTHT